MIGSLGSCLTISAHHLVGDANHTVNLRQQDTVLLFLNSGPNLGA